MTLSLAERLSMLMPPSVFYRRRIAQEARTGEPELAVLAELVPRGGIAVDVGANVGFFAYALADIADRVLAFEPNEPYESAPISFTMEVEIGGDATEADKRRLLLAAQKGCFVEQSLKPGLIKHRLKIGGRWVDA